MQGYYTSGEFAKKANVSIRTIRYYDKQGLLKPAGMSEAGYRLYTDSDFAKLQKILSLKYLGFSLDEIRSITINDDDNGYVEQSLELQLDLVKKRIEHLKLVEQTLSETSKLVKDNPVIDWNKILHLIILPIWKRAWWSSTRMRPISTSGLIFTRNMRRIPSGGFRGCTPSWS